MEVTFLGTGSAWGVPEYGCPCRICRAMAEAGQERTRTSLFVEAGEKILIDPGPDIRRQMFLNPIPEPEAILISHEHLDHMGGLDELLCFRRSRPRDDWRALPCFAHAEAWPGLEARFGYLFPKTLAKNVCRAGQPLEGLRTEVRPFKTEHGPVARGSVGFIIVWQGKKLVYTSDFIGLPEEPEGLGEADLLVLQTHFFSEPEVNRPNHMSLQNALPYLERWRPRRVVLVHLGAADCVPGDPANNIVKKRPPARPLADARGRPFEVPLTTDDWARLAPQVLSAHGLDLPVEPAREGMKISL